MTDDIITRLEKKAHYTDSRFDNGSLGELYREAASTIKALREALEPFAAMADDVDDLRDDAPLIIIDGDDDREDFTASDVRKAVAALNRSRADG